MTALPSTIKDLETSWSLGRAASGVLLKPIPVFSTGSGRRGAVAEAWGVFCRQKEVRRTLLVEKDNKQQ